MLTIYINTREFVYHLYRPYRWTRFLGSTLCPCNNDNYLIHERILHIYRSCIRFSICTDGQLRFTDGEFVYHLYRPYRWTRFLGSTLCPCNNANYLIHERILHIYRSCIHSPSVPTDNFDLPMENSFTIGTDRTDGQGFWGLPYALAIMLINLFINSDAILNRDALWSIQGKNHHVKAAIVRGIRRTGKVLR